MYLPRTAANLILLRGRGDMLQYIISPFKFPKNYITTRCSSHMMQLHKITVH